MKKKIVALVITICALLSLCACGTVAPQGGNADGGGNTGTEKVENKKYQIGETWTVDGQWSLTINSVAATDERNEFEESNPAAVYIIDYSYSNIGYTDANGIMDGLFFGLDEGIVDCKGVMGRSYPGDISKYPQETPVGATCNAQSCVGVSNAGSFEITVIQYDGKGVKQTATFSLTVE